MGLTAAIGSNTISGSSAETHLHLAAYYLTPHWYAAYTCARHEKRVAAQLAGRSVESFLPLYTAVHCWKNRRVRVEVPLFPGYVFVHIALKDRLQVLQIPSVVRLVGFNDLPVPIPNEQLRAIRNAVDHELRAEPHPYLTVGRRVRIASGPLEGLEGIMLRKKSSFRVVLSLELIKRSIVADVAAADVVPIRRSSLP